MFDRTFMVAFNLDAMLLLLSLMVNAFTWVYIFSRFKHMPAAQLYLAYVLMLLLWQGTSSFRHFSFAAEEVTWLFKFGSMGWLFLGALFLAFVYRTVGRKADAWIYTSLLLALVFTTLSWTTDYIGSGSELSDKGWMLVPGPLHVASILLVVALPAVLSLGVLWRASNVRKVSRRRRNQLNLLFYSTAIALCLGVLFSVVLPRLFDNKTLLMWASYAVSIQSLAVFIAIVRYRFLGMDVSDVVEDLFAQMNDGVFIVDEDGNILNLNKAGEEMFVSRASVGMSIASLLGQSYDAEQIEKQELSMQQGGKWLHISIGQTRISNDGGVGKMIVCSNITMRKEAEKELRLLASTDPLTGLSNRRSFFAAAEGLRAQSLRYQRPLAVMMLDIDHFKLVNDTFGHDAGDDIIRLVANLMRESLREVDVLARFGGEEFAIVLPETDYKASFEVAERIRSSIEAFKLETNKGFIDIKLSIGLTMLSPKDKHMQAALTRADELLYRAKRGGRNRVEARLNVADLAET